MHRINNRLAVTLLHQIRAAESAWLAYMQVGRRSSCSHRYRKKHRTGDLRQLAFRFWQHRGAYDKLIAHRLAPSRQMRSMYIPSVYHKLFCQPLYPIHALARSKQRFAMSEDYSLVRHLLPGPLPSASTSCQPFQTITSACMQSSQDVYVPSTMQLPRL